MIQLNSRIPDKLKKFEEIIKRMARKGASDMVAHMLDSMSGPKSGRIYRRGAIKRGRGKNRATVGYRIHQASAPGESPARDSSNLANTMTQIQEEEGGLRQVIPLPPYGWILENKLNRKYIRPAKEHVVPAMERVIDQLLQRL